MGIVCYLMITNYTPIPILFIFIVIWAFARKAKILKATQTFYKHRTKKAWCYIIIALCVIIELILLRYFLTTMLQNPIFYISEISIFLDNPDIYIFMPFIEVPSILAPFSPLFIWWKCATKKELMLEQSDGYQKKIKRCNAWIIVGIVWLVLGAIGFIGFIASIWAYIQLNHGYR